jgi:uncharacterized protein (DUF58 family)
MSETVILERPLSAAAEAAGNVQRRRVYIFLTREGFLFSITLLVMLLGAVNYTNSMAYILTFLLGSVFLVCMLHTYRNLRGLMVRLVDAQPVFAGERARFPVLFDNRGGYARPALEVIARRTRDRKAGMAVPAFADLQAGEAARVHLDLATRRRGLCRPGRLVVQTRWPLGLFRAWSYLEGDALGIVYPRPAGTAVLPPRDSDDAAQLPGRGAGTDDFAGFRSYRPGDSIRSIDWKALAREQGLLTKRFSGAGSGKISLHWDAVPLRIDTEARLSQLCRWVLEADRLGLIYALEIPGTRIPHGQGESHLRACLEALALYQVAREKGKEERGK